MIGKKIKICIALLLSSHLLSAQQGKSTGTLVLYDPLFWKSELKLDAFQAKRIREINSEYYERLMTAIKNEGSDRNRLQAIATESLAERSQQIWSTFHHRQKKKWKKMWLENESEFSGGGTAATKAPPHFRTSP
jgi:hypothetical protein